MRQKMQKIRIYDSLFAREKTTGMRRHRRVLFSEEKASSERSQWLLVTAESNEIEVSHKQRWRSPILVVSSSSSLGLQTNEWWT